jgi:hypothetical protein
MNTTSRIRFTALIVAISITALVQGTMLWCFDTVAQQTDQQSAKQVTLSATTGQNS